MRESTRGGSAPDALQLRLQFANPNVPYQLFAMPPCLASILAHVRPIGKPTPPTAGGVPNQCEAAA